MKTLTRPTNRREQIALYVYEDLGLHRVRPKDPRNGIAKCIGDCPVCGAKNGFSLTISIPGKRIVYHCYRCWIRTVKTNSGAVQSIQRPGVEYHDMLRDSDLVIEPGDFTDNEGYVFPGVLIPTKQSQLRATFLRLLSDPEHGTMTYRQCVERIQRTAEHQGVSFSERTIRRTLDDLVADGKIERHRERKANGTFGPVSYSLVKTVGFDFDKYVPEGVKAGVA